MSLFEGECESCGFQVEENELYQCQLGFCGTFLCSNCFHVCSLCPSHDHDFPEEVLKFCRTCSDDVIPICLGCSKRFCGRCTSFRRCFQCLRLACSRCTTAEENQITLSGKCSSCTGNDVKCLQLICRDVIRRNIACNMSDVWTFRSKDTPTDFINEEVKKFDMPQTLLDLLTVDTNNTSP